MSIGATEALEPGGAVEKIVGATGGGVDVSIECVGQPSTMVDCFNLIRAGGRCIVVGLPAFTETITLPAIMLLREKTITGSIYGSANPAVDFQKIAAVDLFKREVFEDRFPVEGDKPTALFSVEDFG